jgi:hypothetical protein
LRALAEVVKEALANQNGTSVVRRQEPQTFEEVGAALLIP